MSERRILSNRSTEIDKRDTLHDNIPKWMENSIWNWLSGVFTYKTSAGYTRYMNSTIRNVELHIRQSFGTNSEDRVLFVGLYNTFTSSPVIALDILQATVELAYIQQPGEHTSVTSLSKIHVIHYSSIEGLNTIIQNGGSKWRIVVSGNQARMESRVDAAMHSAYDKLSMSKEDYAKHLKEAWLSCFGRDPNPSAVYTSAIKAVEAAAWPVISPKDSKATLGTILGAFDSLIKARKLKSGFHDNEEAQTLTMAHSVMSRLWKSQTDRHATGNYKQPSQAEAESAVHLAILVCQLFSSGMIARNN